MATLHSMQKCINLASKETQEQLPESVKQALEAGRKDLLIAALQEHDSKLQQLQKEIVAQHKDKRQQLVATFPAAEFTAQTHDPTNELNTFAPKGGLTLLAKNLVQRAGSVYNAVKKFLVFTKEDKEVVQDFLHNFAVPVAQALDELFQAKQGSSLSFRHEDMLQYFPQTADKTLHPTVKEAIAATLYEWLGNEASRTSMGSQTESTLRLLLGLPKDASISPNALTALQGMGANSETLADSLGRTILERLAIAPTEDADALARPRMEASLGLMAIAALEQLGLVTRQELRIAAIDQLKEGIPLSKEEVFFDAARDGSREGLGLLNSVLLKSAPENPKEPVAFVAKIEALMNQAPDVFDKMYANQVNPSRYAFDKIPLPKSLRAGRSSLEISPKQKKNLQKYMDTPWVPSSYSMPAFEAMLALTLDPEADPALLEAFGTIMGKQSAQGKLLVRQKSIDALNNGIDRNIRNIRTFLEQTRNKQHSRFYIPGEFMNNMRMLMRGFINPQNSKIDRNLFAPESWKTSFEPNYKVRKFVNKQGTERAFLEAVAQALDIESGKKGGVEAQLQELDTLLNHRDALDTAGQQKHDSLWRAIEALRVFDRTGKMTAELLSDIAVGVQASGMKLHGFKGLQEYARYLNHKQLSASKRKALGGFSTDIYKEIDGVSNGPILSMLMFLSDSGNMQDKLAVLAMGGISIATQEVNLDELLGPKYKYLNDAYQRMGQIWAQKVEEMKAKFRSEGLTDLLKQTEAIGKLLGPFYKQDGTVSSVVRNLSKPRTVQTTYGAGQKRQMKLFADIDLVHGGIYKRVEEILADIHTDPDSDDALTNAQIREKILTLVESVNALVHQKHQLKVENFLYTDGAFNVDNLLAFELKPEAVQAIEHAVTLTYGEAMGQAIDEVYAPLIDARKPLLEAVSASTVLYNTLLKAKVEHQLETNVQTALAQLKEQKGKLHPKDEEAIRKSPKYRRITKKELTRILKELEPVLPKIPTPLHGPNNESYLQLVSSGKQKKYAEQTVVRQSYRSGTLTRQKSRPEGIPFLDSPGVSPIVRSIQMLDSMIANHLMGLDIDILNNHDGFSHRITDSRRIGEEANKELYRILKDYSLADEIHKMHESTTAAAREMFTEMGLKGEDLFDTLVDERLIDKQQVMDEVVAQRLQAIPGLNEEEVAKQVQAEMAALVEENKDKGGLDYFAANREAIKDLVLATSLDKGTLVKKRLLQVRRLSESMAETVTRNKDTLVPFITQIAQYSDGGLGFNPAEANLTDTTVFGLARNAITQSDALQTQAVAADLASIQQALLGSSPNSTATPLEQDFPHTAAIDALNVSQVFETIVQQDEQAGFGSVPVSPGHKNHLIRVLDDIVAKVMAPVQLFQGVHAVNNETMGLYEVEGSKIWLQTQQATTQPPSGMLGQGIRMSAAEVYVHELTHHITYSGLKQSPYLHKQAYDLYEFARDAFEQRYGDTAFRVFMNDPAADLTDPNNAFEILAAKERWNYVFEPEKQKNKTHQGVDEFLTFGLTNENFKRALADLTLPDKPVSKAKFGIFEKNVQQTVVNLFNKIMDFIHTQFLKQQHAKQADQKIENLVRALSEIDKRAKSGVYATFVNASNRLADLGTKADDKVKETFNKAVAATKAGQLRNNLKELKERQIFDVDNFISYQVRRALNWYGDTDSKEGFLHSVVTEMKGLTGRLQPFHEMLNWRNRVLDTAKMDATEGVRREVNAWFKRELSSKEKTVYTEVGLKIDLSYLVNRHTAATLTDLVGNQQAREQRIAALLLKLREDPELAPHRHFFEKASDDLGYFMIHSAIDADGVPFMNAHNIVSMQDLAVSNKPTGEAFAKALDIVEELATLASLRYVPEADKRILTGLMREDWEAFENILHLHNHVKREALQDSFHNQPGKMQKGYVKQILNDRIQYQQGTLRDQAAFTRMGYVMEATPITRDPHDPVREDIYMFKSITGMVNPLQAGIASLTTNTKRGQDPLAIQFQLGNITTGPAEAEKAAAHMQAVMQKKLRRMYSSTPRKPRTHVGSQNHMIPHFDDRGKMQGMRYMMSEHTKKTVLQQFGEVDAVLGAMASQVIDKKMTPKVNAELVTALKDFYDAEYDKNPQDFVDVSPASTDADLREIYYRLPDKMRQQIRSIWGRDGMQVSRDMLTLAFGQSKYSIIEVFNKDAKQQKVLERSVKEVLIFALGANNPFYSSPLNTQEHDTLQMRRDKQIGRAVIRAKRIEEFLTQLTKYAKSNIVVRNLKVIRGNYLSNIALLLSHGVPLHEVIKGAREAVNSALVYQGLHQRYQSALIQRNVLLDNARLSPVAKQQQLKVLERHITRLEDELARNPSKAMIDAGLLPSIVDDIDTARAESPYTHGLDRFLDTSLSKLPSKLERATRVLFMTEDTEGFRMMNNAVKMTDYVGRYVLYKHLTQKKNMSHRDAVAATLDKFINFDLPTHKSLEYLNSIGLVFFSKYQLRVLKHIKNVVKEAPFSALAVYLLGSFTGVGDNIINNIPGFTKNATQNFSTAWAAFADTPKDVLYLDLAMKVGGSVVR